MTGRPVLALDFGGSKIAVAVAGADGRILGRSVLETKASQGAMQAVDRAVAEGRRLMLASDATRPAAVGVSSMGITRDDAVVLAPNVPGWEGLQLPGYLGDAFGAPVVIWNDVKAAALGEIRWGSLQGASDALYVNLGTGLAIALVIGGSVFLGAHGAAGEIGYSLRGLDEGPGVAAGRAPLEEWAAGAGLRRRAASELGQELNADELSRRADRDPRARGLLEDAAAHTTFHLTNLTIALDPSRIVVGGGLLRAMPDLMERFRRALDCYVPFPPELRMATFIDDAPLRGAVALAIDRLPEHP
ncbi:MAG: ROK family protein [Candidatus Dormibacteraeota bacterium]|nr:ROK family protein [Candidatus Dormibacteraeota bacterium]